MGKIIKNNIQLVISHLEGCSGNFLARLYTGYNLQNQSTDRTDINLDPQTLSTNGRDTWELELKKLDQHRALVTHNFNQELIAKTFPSAKLVQIYPYTHLGNVLYNISHKKLSLTIENVLDNHLINITEWYQHLISNKPNYTVTNFGSLTQPDFVENLLGIKFNTEQQDYFNRYWKNQLPYDLSLPAQPMRIQQLVEYWGIQNWISPWSIAYTIFAYELLNKLPESSRHWSIDTEIFNNWDDVASIEPRYNID